MRLKTIEEIQYIPVRVRYGKVYYFDKNGAVTICAIKDIPEIIKNNILIKYKKELLYVRKEYSFEEYMETYFKKFKLEDTRILEFELGTDNVSLPLKKAMAQLKEGDNYEDLKRYLKKSFDYYNNMYKTMAKKNGVYHDKPVGLDRFIVKINKPIILREPENNNPNTFDFIKVQIDIINQWNTDKTQYIKNNKKEIVKRTVEKIAQDKAFIKYGVAVNILALTNIVRLNANTIELIFELKKKIRMEYNSKKS